MRNIKISVGNRGKRHGVAGVPASDDARRTTASNSKRIGSPTSRCSVIACRVSSSSRSSKKQLAYYLYEAGLSGRDIFYDQKSPHNLAVRKTLEAILRSYKGERAGKGLGRIGVSNVVR